MSGSIVASSHSLLQLPIRIVRPRCGYRLGLGAGISAVICKPTDNALDLVHNGLHLPPWSPQSARQHTERGRIQHTTLLIGIVSIHPDPVPAGEGIHFHIAVPDGVRRVIDGRLRVEDDDVVRI